MITIETIIRLQIKDQLFELTKKEAMEIYNALHKEFGPPQTDLVYYQGQRNMLTCTTADADPSNIRKFHG